MRKLVASEERIKEVVLYFLEHDRSETEALFGLNGATLDRYIRDYKQIDEDFESKAVFLKLQERFSKEELNAIVKSGTLDTSTVYQEILSMEGEEFSILGITDSHIGSKYLDDRFIDIAFEYGDKVNVDMAVHSGDLTEGMSNRTGHVYELSQVGYDHQKEHSVKLISSWKRPIFIIDGNHDRWYLKSIGALIVKDICERIPNAVFLGHDEGKLFINGAEIRPWHGEDFSSYATSYRLQKVVEALTPDDVPQMLLVGHTHKHMYEEIGGCHVVSLGSLQSQSKWMRSKRMAADVGFWIIKFAVVDGRIPWIEPRWHTIRYKKIYQGHNIVNELIPIPQGICYEKYTGESGNTEGIETS